jgi:outer membrane lipoprotein-sorting protein
MQKLKIREDRILLRQAFFDEDRKLVKALTMERIEMLGGRLYPVKWKMQKAGQKEKYTVLDYQILEFDVDISDRMFTIASLKNARL